MDSSIILNGNREDEQENNDRLKIMKKFRGYPDEELFERFPNIEEWKFLELNESDIDNYLNTFDSDIWQEKLKTKSIKGD